MNVRKFYFIFNLNFSDGKNPSAAQYEIKSLMNGTGQIGYNSKFRTVMAKTFSGKLKGDHKRFTSKNK